MEMGSLRSSQLAKRLSMGVGDMVSLSFVVWGEQVKGWEVGGCERTFFKQVVGRRWKSGVKSLLTANCSQTDMSARKRAFTCLV
jgi:hypothetical protein